MLYEHQYGFHRDHFTQQAIVTLIERIYIYITVNSKNMGVTIFIDLRKAFDCVTTDILLAKLQAYGIRGNMPLNGRKVT